MTGERLTRWGLRYIALAYLALLLVIPLGYMMIETFSEGIQPVLDSITEPDSIAALKLTLLTVAIAVPLNTVFGIAAAHVVVRTKFRFKWAINALIDMPFAVSPVVIGLALVLVYGTGGWFGADLAAMGIQVIFSTP
ncbi:MAG: sulfate ABC transporter, partial [Solirubrobacterales bacterium]|nr:sulfate ABC transporter [Solirubrobacterales bacterium]